VTAVPRLLVLTILGASVGAATAGADNEPPFKITTKRADDRVDVRAEKDKVIVSIQSPFGISRTSIERGGEKWRAVVVLRLHLKGLENFKVTNGKVKLEGSASLHDGKPQVRLWKDGKEDAPLDARSPYWMDVRIGGGDGRQTKEIPLRGGYFELPLPGALFESNPKAVTASWIDFYRN
jgi:hypothetical protein